MGLPFFIFGGKAVSPHVNKETMDRQGTIRNQLEIGMAVLIVQKHHQRSGELTEGIIKRILTSSPAHHHGIKVMLASGEVGRVKKILEE